jgi:hypothetical protein
MIRLAKPTQQVYYSFVKMSKAVEEALRKVRRELASAGGKARAKKYDKKTLSKWAKKGGRPRKRKAGAR